MGDTDGGPIYIAEDIPMLESRLEKAIFTYGFVVGSGVTLVGLLVVGLALALLGVL